MSINDMPFFGNGGSNSGNIEMPDFKTINGVSVVGSGNINIEGTSVDGIPAELASSIGVNPEYKDITKEFTLKTGAYSASTGKVNTSKTDGLYTDVFAVKKGEKYKVTGSCSGSWCLIALYDENQTFIKSLGFSELGKYIGTLEYEVSDVTIEDVVKTVAFMSCSTYESSKQSLIIEKEVAVLKNVQEEIGKVADKFDKDLVELDEKLTLTVKNICPNSDFQDVSIWELGNTATTMTVENNIATLTNDGSNARTRITMPLTSIPENHIIYVQASIKSSPNTIWEGFNIYTDANYTVAYENPRLKNSVSLFNDYYGTFDFSQTTPSNAKLWITSTYQKGETAKDQVTQIKNVFICDLTESFGAGKEPTASEFYNILKAGGSWFKDSRQIFMVDLIKPTLPIVSDYLITVGENGDCQTINEAIERASKVYPAYKKRGIKVEIRILDGTIIDEQILVESLDLSYISITTDNADNKVIVTPTAKNWDKNTVSHDSRGNMPFFAGEFGARLPVIKCLFSCTSPTLHIDERDIGIVGYYCNRGSMGVMAVGSAYPENTTQSGAGEIEAEVGFEGFYDCVIANNNSEITLRECIARNAGRYGIMSRHISRVSARSADLTNCGTIINEKVKNNETVTETEKETCAGAYADRSSMMDVRFANVSGSFNGIQSFNTSNATAVETIANNITNIVADARAGSTINCDAMTIDNVKDVFKVSKGSTIIATATPTNVSGTLYSKEKNTLNVNGIIYAK